MKVILIDDETLALEFLHAQLIKIDQVEVIGKFTHFDMNEHSSLLNEADVIFLDIEMPELNGLELAEIIMERHTDISIVFVTAYQQYAVQAFELHALDYVLKPCHVDRLRKTWDRVKANHNRNAIQGENVSHTLCVHVAKELSFEKADGELEYIQWRTTKTQELFLYLLHHCNKIIRKSDLIELLWPDNEDNKSYPQLYTAIYHLRKTLKKFKEHFIIKNVGEGYILSIKNVAIDVREWENKILEAPPLELDTIEEYESIMSLYKGHYLHAYDYLWAEAERYRLAQLWLKVAYQIAHFYEKQNKVEMAKAWYNNICYFQPEEEHAHLALMKLFHASGHHTLVVQQYTELESVLNELHVPMSPHVKSWYEQWRK